MLGYIICISPTIIEIFTLQEKLRCKESSQHWEMGTVKIFDVNLNIDNIFGLFNMPVLTNNNITHSNKIKVNA